jgi:transglutaminase-like putative cysteine protease
MRIRLGYEIIYECPQPTPMILTLNVHYTRTSDLEEPDHIHISPAVPMAAYRDGFGNWCSRIVAAQGVTRIASSCVIRDRGLADPIAPWAIQHAVQDLPEETLVFLLGSRYCETDHLSKIAWDLFGTTPLGWGRVKAICDFVHHHITFGYEFASPTKTALEAFNEKRGVCRDYAHLAIAFCRALNIPARYCTGYLGDIGIPGPYGPMDFAGWMEVFLGGQWHIFDPRNNMARQGRILIARGRDASDVAITSSFGPAVLKGFTVVCDEIVAA